MDEKHYTPIEVAEMFQISKHTVYELIKRGELQAYKIGNKMRIGQNEINSFKQSTKSSIRKKTDLPTASSSPLLQLSGSHDFLIEHLIKFGQSRHLQIHPSYIGSLEGLMLLYRGQADAAAIHLLEPSSQEYNIPFIKQLFVHESITVVRLASREQGLIIAKDNPKNILSFFDLKRKEVTFVNRQKGSGTRFSLDSRLNKDGILPDQINGYEQEEWNHLSAASYISNGAADVTFGIRSAAIRLDLEFIPITVEPFDLILRWSDKNKDLLKTLLSLIQSNEFRDSLTDLKGYDLRDLGKIIYQNAKMEEPT